MIPPVGPEIEKIKKENIQKNNAERNTNVNAWNADMSYPWAFVLAIIAILIAHIFGLVSLIMLRK